MTLFRSAWITATAVGCLLLCLPSPTRADDVQLEWTAPGENAAGGRVIGYDIRYSSTPIGGDTLTWWNSASQAIGEPSPSDPGTTENFLLTNLFGNVTYQILLRSSDEVGNQSPFSNVAVVGIADTTGGGADPVVIDGAAVDSIQGAGARVRWNTNVPAIGFVRYGTTANYGQTTSPQGPVTSHAATLTGLTAGQSVHYQIVSYDGAERDSTPDAVFGTAELPPDRPAGLEAAPGPGLIAVGWDPVNDPDLANYLVYYHADAPADTGWLYEDQFHPYQTGTDPPTWEDADNRFAVARPPDNRTVYEGTPAGPAAVATYKPGGVDPSWDDVEVKGAFRLEPGGDAGLVLRRTNQSHYVVRFRDGQPVAIDGVGASPVPQPGAAPVSPVANLWYAFRATVWNDGGTVRIGCAVWPEGETEPLQNQARATDDGASALSAGGVGFSVAGSAATRFDDIIVNELPPATTESDLGQYTTWLHSSLSPDSVYFYRVVSVDQSGTRSMVSHRVSASPLPVDVGDTTAPSRINDFTATKGGGLGLVNVAWSAVGDDGLAGTASAYDLRYSFSPVTDANWTSATRANTGIPKASGSPESLVLNLSAGHTYYLAIRAIDDAGNASPTSNLGTVNLPSDVQGPGITGVRTESVGVLSALVRWETNEPATSEVRFGLTPAYEIGSVSSQILTTTHTMGLYNLTPETAYYFEARASDSFGNESTSGGHFFLTGGEEDSTGLAVLNMQVLVIDDTAASVSFGTNLVAVGAIEYGTTTSYGNEVGGVAFSNQHNFSLAPLLPETAYHFRGRAVANGDTTYSDDFVIVTAPPGGFDSDPPVLSAIAADSITTSGARIGWTTDEPARVFVEYGLTESYGQATTLTSLYATQHAVRLEGLATGREFHYRIHAEDASQNDTVSDDFTFLTLPESLDTFGPVLSDIGAVSITPASVHIVWSTDEPSDGQIEYGTSIPYANATPLADSLSFAHDIMLSELTPNTQYHFRILSRDGKGNLTRSSDFTFTTENDGDIDSIPPVISSIVLSDATSSSITVTWLTDEAAAGQIEYGLDTTYGSQTTLEPEYDTDHAVQIAGLTADVVFHYRILSRDPSGNESRSGDRTFVLNPSSDTTPPEIEQVTVIDVTSQSARIAWSTNENAEGQIEYGLTESYSSATPVDTAHVLEHEVLLEDLERAATYHFRVVSRDPAGNVSFSDDLVLTTSGDVDSIGPTLANVDLMEVEEGVVQVSWNTDEEAIGRVEYGLDSASLALSTSLGTSFLTEHFYEVDGLAIGRQFFFRALARDLAGNESASDVYSVWIGDAPDSLPPTFSGDVITVPGIREAEITWITDEPADSRVLYGLDSTTSSSTSLDAIRVTLHRVTLTNLRPDADHYFRLESRDAADNLSRSELLQFSTLPDTVNKAPALESVETAFPVETVAVLAWTTDLSSTGQILYGVDTETSIANGLSGVFAFTHLDTLERLEPETRYYYRIQGTGENGIFFQTALDSFWTPADRTPPPPPPSFGGTESSQGIQIAWAIPAEESPAAYAVFRTLDEGEDAVWDKIADGEGGVTEIVDELDGLDLRGVAAVRYEIALYDAYGNESRSETIVVSLDKLAVPIVQTFLLHPNRPNPFNPTTVIPFSIPESAGESRVKISIYNMVGREIRTLLNESRAPGTYTDVAWNGVDRIGKNVPSGRYFYRLQAGGKTTVRSMILIR
ncbi:MAG: hypothetical protein HKN20_10165 [Gemmatimonadetes bacterium]|nr:hypothetical protein [Gemmatimonadota bacterium]